MKITLIHNPDAGKDEQASGDDLTRLIERAGHTVRYQSCRRADWRDVLMQPADLVAIAGGDGIVGTTATELLGRGIPAAILPMGTANNLATAFGLRRRKLEELIAGWNDGRLRNFDVAVAKGPWGSTDFIEGLGIGAFTETMSRLDARKNIDLAHHDEPDKKIQSVLHIMKIRLEGAAPLPLKLHVDGMERSGEFVMLEAMNIRSIGPNLELAPEADPGDGLLDVVLVTEQEKANLDAYLTSRIAGQTAHPQLPTYRARQLRIESDEIRVHIDDDVWPKHGEHPPFTPMIIEVGIHPEKLEILVPA